MALKALNLNLKLKIFFFSLFKPQKWVGIMIFELDLLRRPTNYAWKFGRGILNISCKKSVALWTKYIQTLLKTIPSEKQSFPGGNNYATQEEQEDKEMSSNWWADASSCWYSSLLYSCCPIPNADTDADAEIGLNIIWTRWCNTLWQLSQLSSNHLYFHFSLDTVIVRVY